MTLLRQNSELRRDRIWNWTLPASTTVLPDGRRVNCCPAADGCILLCYARTGTYRFPQVVAAHQRNLQRVLDDLNGWSQEMIDELSARRFRPSGVARDLSLDLDEWAARWAGTGGAAVRIHDAGDFFSDEYLETWLEIARTVPDVLFYAYTKEISRFRALVEDQAPENFRWCYSLGGRYDHLLDHEHDRHADVFPDVSAVTLAGYTDQSASDLIAVLAPTTRVGIPVNNHPHIRRRMAGETFGAIQIRRTNKREGSR